MNPSFITHHLGNGMPTHLKFFSVMAMRVRDISDFFYLLPGKLGPAIFLSSKSTRGKAILTLPRSVHHIVMLIPQIKVIRVTASCIRTVWAFMKNPKPARYWTPKENPRNPAGPSALTPPVSPSANLTVTIVQGCGPKPTSVLGRCKINFGPPSVVSRWGKVLRFQVLGISIRLHNQMVWLCHALGYSTTARAFSL